MVTNPPFGREKKIDAFVFSLGWHGGLGEENGFAQIPRKDPENAQNGPPQQIHWQGVSQPYIIASFPNRFRVTSEIRQTRIFRHRIFYTFEAQASLGNAGSERIMPPPRRGGGTCHFQSGAERESQDARKGRIFRDCLKEKQFESREGKITQ